jgi:hypothetical protein
MVCIECVRFVAVSKICSMRSAWDAVCSRADITVGLLGGVSLDFFRRTGTFIEHFSLISADQYSVDKAHRTHLFPTQSPLTIILAILPLILFCVTIHLLRAS